MADSKAKVSAHVSFSVESKVIIVHVLLILLHIEGAVGLPLIKISVYTFSLSDGQHQ